MKRASRTGAARKALLAEYRSRIELATVYDVAVVSPLEPARKLSARLPATGIIFRQTSGDYDLDWHPAPRRQYIINLDAGVEITASDGESRVIGAGEVILVEDVSGKGHLSKAVGGKMRHSIFVPIE